VSASSPEIGLTENEGPGSNLKSLFAVFFITWMAFFAYLFFLSRRLRSMKQEIMELKKIINGNNSKK
jgi:CcmD family protein